LFECLHNNNEQNENKVRVSLSKESINGKKVKKIDKIEILENILTTKGTRITSMVSHFVEQMVNNLCKITSKQYVTSLKNLTHLLFLY
jgi:hypothetical protein